MEQPYIKMITSLKRSSLNTNTGMTLSQDILSYKCI